MKVCFVLPPAMRRIAGGYKVVYQYSNYLIQKGVHVDIVYDSRMGDNSIGIPKYIMLYIRKAVMFIEPRWFSLDKRIKKRCVKNIEKKYFKDRYDIVICTAIDTMIKCKKEGINNCIHFIQGHENAFLSNEEVENVYKYDCPKIVISEWLLNIIKKYNNYSSLYLVKNGIDVDLFKKKDKDAIKHSITMMYVYNSINKNSEMGIRIFERLKQEIPDLKIQLFSVDPKPQCIPDWISYFYNATENEVADIMRKSQIYVCTSNQEGYGLPPLEAMACECAVVTTDNKGVLEYVVDNENGLVSPIRDEETMYNNIVKLFEDNELLTKISKKGYKTAMNLSLKTQSERFYKALQDILKNDF